MENVVLKLKLKDSYDYVSYQSDMFYKHKTKVIYQTPYSLIEEILLENKSDNDYVDLRIVFKSSESILNVKDILISELYKHSKTKITQQIHIDIDLKAIYSLTESLPIKLDVSLIKDDTNEILFETNYDICLNPIDQILSKSNADKTLLSCLVTPNAKQVETLISKAQITLSNQRKDQPNFIGYQANSIDSIRQEMKAIFDTLVMEGIFYSNPPASFETFQRVRTPSYVLNNKKGTCLDLSLLYCACLENVGLRPILIIIKGHAFAGCFLNEESFQDYQNESIQHIVNKSSSGNMSIELVECVNFTNGFISSFNDATKAARNHLELYNDYFAAIDIYRCHNSYYRPIPTFEKDEPIILNITNSIKDEELTLQEPNNKGIFEVDEFKGNKFEYWAKKLLDLNLKNRLINFKFNKQVLQINVMDINLFFNHILNEENFNIVFDNINLRDHEYLSSFNEYNTNDEARRIYHCLSDDKIYKNILRKADLSLDETGSPIFYLSLGLIHFVPNKSKVSFIAPLFLIPAKGKKRSNNGCYQIELVNDEVTINTTVLEYIKQTCGVSFDDLYALKKDEIFSKHIEIINTIRNRSCKDCQISVDAQKVYLSLFSFSHYIMWDDIKKRQDALMENPIIQSLVNNTLVKISEDDDQLETNPDEIAVPLGADSSQIKAIIDAEKGESFVLDGPPGTGKSQTIVNMIINAIYHGKTVLFVAEKMAALDVVKKRIDDLNLGFLCLELHSNKSNKKDMLDHLKKSLEYEKILGPDNFNEATDTLMNKKDYLNQLILKMSNNTYGVSLYDSVIAYLNLKDNIKIDYPKYEHALTISKKDIDEILDKLSYLTTLADSRKEVYLNAYHPFGFTSLNKDELSSLKNLLKQYQKTVLDLKSSLEEIRYGFNNVIFNHHNLNVINSILNFIKDNDLMFVNLSYVDLLNAVSNLDELFIKGNIIKQHHDDLSKYFKDTIFDMNYQSIYDELLQKRVNFFKKRKIKKQLIKLFKPHLLNKKTKFKNELDPIKVVFNIDIINKYVKEIESVDTPLKFIFNNNNHTYLTCDYPKIKTLLDNAVKVNGLFDDLKDIDNEQFKPLINNFKTLYKSKNDESFIDVYNVINSFNRFKDIETQLIDEYKYDPKHFKYHDDEKYLSLLNESIINMLDNEDDSYVMSSYNLLFNQLLNLRFVKQIISDYRLGKLNASDLRSHFLLSYYQALILEYTKDGFFKEFNSILFNDTIKKYNDAIKEYSTLIVKETASRATKDYPTSNINYVESSKIAKLNRYIRNGGKKTTIRNLLIEFEDLIKTICPVFLMSPMSAAQYLSINNKKFDIVIFDEASQIPTCEAIGAISRGNSLIVAGDPEQMPPTNFFKTNFDIVDDEYDYVDDLESLLDDCLAIKMKRNRLLWHYRSKHESLIAFSNNNFYNHSLYTFPSPDNNFSKVEFKYLKDGIYEKGTNMVEAKQIVKAVQNIFKDENLRHKSIGIITFNIKQCELITSMINDLFESHPEYEKINEENEEKLFVKNLENVQGDERDIIMFSIGFGYNKHKKFSLMFGPLSLEKGERRLNVAITRAKEKMIIFSSIKGNDINTDNIKNKGAEVLKDFLNYAEKGNEALIIENFNQTQPKVGIEKFIQNDLKEYGILSDINVGDSKFRINLCIKNDQGDYILGVLIDGKNYMDIPTCRDRNFVQNQMLNKLKWKFIRVYTYDYFNNKNMVINDILNALKNIQDIHIEPKTKYAKENVVFEKKIVDSYTHKKPYIEKMPLKICDYANIDYFYDEVLDYLLTVIDIEGPIAKSLLMERFKVAFGISRMGNIAKANFESMLKILQRQRLCKKELLDDFYYPYKDENNSINYFRTSTYNVRSIEQIPSIEIVYALKDIIHVQGEVSIDDALKALCNLFGYEKVTTPTLNKMKKHIQYILKHYNEFKLIDDQINIINDK